MIERDLCDGWEFGADGWILPGAKYGLSRLGWLPATVPGHVHLDLIANDVIPSPADRRYELGAEWVDERRWSYRRIVLVEPRFAQQRIRFEGLDTLASIRIDGEVVARSENMFLPTEIDVTGLTEFEVQVDFEPAEPEGARRRTEYLAREGLGDIDLLEHRAFLRKAQFMFGWDWGPRLVSCGIWLPVRLLDFDERILDVEARQAWRGSEARLDIETAGLDVVQPVHRLFDPHGALLAEMRGDGSIDLGEPLLWWDHRRGGQPLYRLESSLGHHTVSHRIGFRRLELVREPDAFGESFEFVLNGERVWALGANWIPHSSLGFGGGVERSDSLLRMARDMGMNMLRVWGGGVYESEAFYDGCDALGILVWQDFPFACSYYPDGESMQELVRRPSIRCGDSVTIPPSRFGAETTRTSSSTTTDGRRPLVDRPGFSVRNCSSKSFLTS